jgi:predicted aspartyl protease
VVLRLIVALILVFVVGARVSHAAEIPDVATVREHVRAAGGTELAMERETVAYETFGLHGKRTTLRIGADFREDVTFGPLMTASGTIHGHDWHQNANGQTVIDQPDSAGVTDEPVQRTTGTKIAPITTPVIGFVLSSSSSGAVTKDYVESSTWHIVRRDRISGSETTTYTYDDFRTVAGQTKPWHWTARDGDPQDDAEDRIVSDDAGPVTEADLAIPPPRRNLTDFPEGKTSVSLPVRKVDDQFIAHVYVGSRALDLVIDTGASGIVLDDAAVALLGLKTYGSYTNAANAGRYKTTSAIVPEMDIGDLKMHDVVVHTIPHFPDDHPGQYILSGLLGFDFIASVVLKMDYEHSQVTAIDPSAFSPPRDKRTDALVVRVGDGQPLTDVKVNGAVGDRFAVDTGAGTGLLVFNYFARRHPEALKDTSGGILRKGQMMGVGGLFQTDPYQLDSVQVGNVIFKKFIAQVVASSNAYGGDDDGLVGSEFLKFYTVYTDYVDSMIYLVPNSLGTAGFEP